MRGQKHKEHRNISRSRAPGQVRIAGQGWLNLAGRYQASFQLLGHSLKSRGFLSSCGRDCLNTRYWLFYCSAGGGGGDEEPVQRHAPVQLRAHVERNFGRKVEITDGL